MAAKHPVPHLPHAVAFHRHPQHDTETIVTPNPNTLIHAHTYADNGYEIFPANPRTKTPLTPNGMKDATTNHQQINEWWQQHPDALIACRIPPHLVVLDIDPRHGGHNTWTELQNAYATIICNRIHRSGRNDGGAHHWFLRPPGRLSIKNLTDWAQHNNVGQPILDKNGNPTGKWTCGIDILHHDHRYSILPPSPHPATGQPYRWDTRGEEREMPPFLAQLITQTEPTPTTTHTHTPQTDSIADHYSNTTTWNQILQPHGWTLKHGNGDEDGSRWQHPTATATWSATIRNNCLFVYTPNTPFPETETGNPNGITKFRAYAILEHGGNMSQAAKHLRPPNPHHNWDTPTPATPPQPQTSHINLPDTFWNTRPALQHIRQAAHSRTRSADAVLAATLARISTLIPPTTKLPAIVGAPGSLNLLIGIIATSGGGKSTSNDVARELIPITRTDIIADIPPGSGEGITELFFELVNEETPEGKTRKIKRQTKTAALIYLDEGQALAEMGNRKGATLLPTLRSAWSGAVIGQSNATTETHRVLKAHSYRLNVIIGFQLEHAAPLIADAAGGTPQRFIYATAIDPTIPDNAPEWPGPLQITPPPTIQHGHEIDFHPDIRQTIRQKALATTRGQTTPNELDSHIDLLRMKIAAILGILDERHNVNLQDWELAGQILTTSNAVRTWIIEHNHHLQQQREQAFAIKLANREAIANQTHTERALRSGARSIAKAIHKTDTPLTTNQLRQTLASRTRNLVPITDIIAHAVDQQWIIQDGDRWMKGPSKPA